MKQFLIIAFTLVSALVVDSGRYQSPLRYAFRPVTKLPLASDFQIGNSNRRLCINKGCSIKIQSPLLSILPRKTGNLEGNDYKKVRTDLKEKRLSAPMLPLQISCQCPNATASHQTPSDVIANTSHQPTPVSVPADCTNMHSNLPTSTKPPIPSASGCIHKETIATTTLSTINGAEETTVDGFTISSSTPVLTTQRPPGGSTANCITETSTTSSSSTPNLATSPSETTTEISGTHSSPIPVSTTQRPPGGSTANCITETSTTSSSSTPNLATSPSETTTEISGTHSSPIPVSTTQRPPGGSTANCITETSTTSSSSTPNLATSPSETTTEISGTHSSPIPVSTTQRPSTQCMQETTDTSHLGSASEGASNCNSEISTTTSSSSSSPVSTPSLGLSGPETTTKIFTEFTINTSPKPHYTPTKGIYSTPYPSTTNYVWAPALSSSTILPPIGRPPPRPNFQLSFNSAVSVS